LRRVRGRGGKDKGEKNVAQNRSGKGNYRNALLKKKHLQKVGQRKKENRIKQVKETVNKKVPFPGVKGLILWVFQ